MCKVVYVTFFYNIFPGFNIWRNIPVIAVQLTPSLSWNPDAHDLIQKSRPLIHNQSQKNPIHFFLCRLFRALFNIISHPHLCLSSNVVQCIFQTAFLILNGIKEFFCTVMQPGFNLCELCVVGSPMNLVRIVLLCNATYVPTFGNCQPKHTTSEARIPPKTHNLIKVRN